MKTVNQTIETSAVFSDNHTHRYSLTKTWDEKKKRAMVLMIAPGISCGPIEDLTTNLCSSNLARSEYGSMEVVNLFSLVQTSSDPKNSFINAYDESTDDYIMKAAKKADSVILAYGSIVKTNRKAYVRAVDIVEKLEKTEKEKLCCITDFLHRQFLHPLDVQIRNEWVLEKNESPSAYLHENAPKGADTQIHEKKAK